MEFASWVWLIIGYLIVGVGVAGVAIIATIATGNYELTIIILLGSVGVSLFRFTRLYLIENAEESA